MYNIYRPIYIVLNLDSIIMMKITLKLKRVNKIQLKTWRKHLKVNKKYK